MMIHTRNLRLYVPSVDSSKSKISAILKSLKPNEKSMSIELSAALPVDIEALAKLKPAFCSVVWIQSEKFNYKKPDEIEPLALAKKVVDAGMNMMIHFTCRYLKKDEAVSVLDEAKRIGVRNIFAMRGITLKHLAKRKSDFKTAVDLIKFIRERYKDHFAICAAGYPTRYPKYKTDEEDTRALKEKVDAGADFIITQAVFNKDHFTRFVGRCRKADIRVPVLPGLWLFGTDGNLKHCVDYCDDKKVCDTLEKLKSDPKALKSYCSDLIMTLSSSLFRDDDVVGVQLFSQNNLGFVEEIVKKL